MSKKNHQRWKHQVKKVRPNTRIVDYCGTAFTILGSKSATKKAISAGRILLNGQKATTANFVKVGDMIEVKGSGVSKLKKLHIDIPIVYEDDYIIVVNKPAGIAVNGNRYKTVENGVAAFAKISSQNDALPRPVAAHRIDVPTKGLVVLAKTKTALINLGKAFQTNQIQKTYFAVVHGKPPMKGTIDEAIDGKKSVTEFETVKIVSSRVYRHLALVALHPITGRTHQLRIHLNNQRHLIVGDKEYANQQKTILGKGLFLCACRLEMKHPITEKDLKIEIKPPARFMKLLEREGERFGRS